MLASPHSKIDESAAHWRERTGIGAWHDLCANVYNGTLFEMCPNDILNIVKGYHPMPAIYHRKAINPIYLYDFAGGLIEPGNNVIMPCVARAINVGKQKYILDRHGWLRAAAFDDHKYTLGQCEFVANDICVWNEHLVARSWKHRNIQTPDNLNGLPACDMDDYCLLCDIGNGIIVVSEYTDDKRYIYDVASAQKTPYRCRDWIFDVVGFTNNLFFTVNEQHDQLRQYINLNDVRTDEIQSVQVWELTDARNAAYMYSTPLCQVNEYNFSYYEFELDLRMPGKLTTTALRDSFSFV